MIKFLYKLNPLLLIFISAMFVILGDYFGKKWSLNPNIRLFVIVVILYSLCSIVYIPVLLNKGLVTSSFLWSLLADMGVIIVGVLIFKEQLNAQQIIGIIFAFLAIYFLNR